MERITFPHLLYLIGIVAMVAMAIGGLASLGGNLSRVSCENESLRAELECVKGVRKGAEKEFDSFKKKLLERSLCEDVRMDNLESGGMFGPVRRGEIIEKGEVVVDSFKKDHPDFFVVDWEPWTAYDLIHQPNGYGGCRIYYIPICK